MVVRHLESTALLALTAGMLLLWSPPDDAGDAPSLLGQAAVFWATLAIALHYTGLRERSSRRRFTRFLAGLPGAAALHVLLIGAVRVLVPEAAPSPGVIVPLWLAGWCGLTGLRAASSLLLRNASERLLLVGATPAVRELAHEIERHEGEGMEIIGVACDPESWSIPAFRCPWVGSPDRLEALVARTRPHRIIVGASDPSEVLPLNVLVDCRLRGIQVMDAAEAFEQLTGRITAESLRSERLLFSRGFLRHRAGQFLARSISFSVAALGLIAAAPVMALVALLIRIDSAGPVLFVQSRVGLRGRRFDMFKFRTMRCVASEPSLWAADNAVRITRVGRWLRKLRLDELPQFWNILRGDMNLVGPRPHPSCNYDLFAALIPHYDLRLAVRPGVTGWAQIRYVYANNLGEETEKVRYDLYYIKHRSLLFDLRILRDTVKVILLGKEGLPAEPVRQRPPERRERILRPAEAGTVGAAADGGRPV